MQIRINSEKEFIKKNVGAIKSFFLNCAVLKPVTFLSRHQSFLQRLFEGSLDRGGP